MKQPLVLFLPILVVSESNMRQHWRTKARRTRDQRTTTCRGLRPSILASKIELPVTITITRLSPRALDSHDNLRTSLKACADGVTDALGLKSDRGPGLRFEYAQECCAAEDYGVRFTIREDRSSEAEIREDLDGPEDYLAMHLAWRGVETPCPKCGGKGSYLYGSTSTWRGGLGGHAMTEGVCDVCWGSGDAERHWQDLRATEEKFRTKLAGDALDDLIGRFHFKSPSIRAEVGDLADLLFAIADGRIGRGKVKRGAREFAGALASMIKPMAAPLDEPAR